MLINCDTCGNVIDRPPSQLSKSGKNYCSKECYTRSGKPRGFTKTGTFNTCEVCGNQFYVPPVRHDAKFCSKACKGIGSRLPEKNCAVCGKKFKPVMGRSDQPCCSLACGHKYRAKGKDTCCEQCGKIFYVPAGRQDVARFCSKKCADIWQGRNKILYTCETCGKQFKKSASHENHGVIRYCSKNCAYKNESRINRLIEMNAKQQAGNPNKLETAGYAILDKMGIKYEPQVLLANKFCVDALIKSHKIIIQFDGDYWHANPKKFPIPDKRQKRRIALDKSQDAYLKKLGYKIVRFWEHEIKKTPQSVESNLVSILAAQLVVP